MMQYNVFMEDFNGKKIVVFNIFSHGRFREDCRKNAKKYKDDREKFLEEVRRDLKYYFWSKAEYEVVLTTLINSPHHPFKEEKIDIYDQVMLNWEVFSNYIWEHRTELARKEVAREQRNTVGAMG